MKSSGLLHTLLIASLLGIKALGNSQSASDEPARTTVKPALFEEIMRENKAAKAAITSIECDVLDVMDQNTSSMGEIHQVTKGKIIVSGDNLRFEGSQQQTGTAEGSMGGTNKLILLVNKKYLISAELDNGRTKRVWRNNDGTLMSEAAALRGSLRAAVSDWVYGIDGNVGTLSDYLLKLKPAWGTAEIKNDNEGHSTLSFLSEGAVMVSIRMAKNHGWAVEEFLSNHAQFHSPTVKIKKHFVEIADKNGVKAWLPDTIHSEHYRHSDKPGNPPSLVSSGTVTLSNIQINKKYEDKLFAFESIAPDSRVSNILMDIEQGMDPTLSTYVNGEWVNEAGIKDRGLSPSDIKSVWSSRTISILGILLVSVLGIVVYFYKRKN